MILSGKHCSACLEGGAIADTAHVIPILWKQRFWKKKDTDLLPGVEVSIASEQFMLGCLTVTILIWIQQLWWICALPTFLHWHLYLFAVDHVVCVNLALKATVGQCDVCAKLSFTLLWKESQIKDSLNDRCCSGNVKCEMPDTTADQRIWR